MDPTLEFDTLGLRTVIERAAAIDPLNNYRSRQDEYEDRIAREFMSIRTSLNHHKTLGKRGVQPSKIQPVEQLPKKRE